MDGFEDQVVIDQSKRVRKSLLTPLMCMAAKLMKRFNELKVAPAAFFLGPCNTDLQLLVGSWWRWRAVGGGVGKPSERARLSYIVLTLAILDGSIGAIFA